MAKRESKLFFQPTQVKGQDIITLSGKETRSQAREVPWSMYRIGGARGPFDLSGNRTFAASRRPGRGLWETFAYTSDIVRELEAHKDFQLQNTRIAREQPLVDGEFDPFYLRGAYIYVNWHVHQPSENVLAKYVYKKFLPDFAKKIGLGFCLPANKLLTSLNMPVAFSISGERELDSIARIECSPTVSFDQILTLVKTAGNLNLFNKDNLEGLGKDVLDASLDSVAAWK